MSSATLDSPSATSRTSAGEPASTENADELIARLASEEIDRLIESEGVTPNERASHVPTLDASIVDNELATQAQATPPSATPPKPTPTDTSSTAIDDADLKAEVLDAVLKSAPPATGSDPLALVEAAEAETPAAEPLAADAVSAEVAAAATPGAEAGPIETSAAEKTTAEKLAAGVAEPTVAPLESASVETPAPAAPDASPELGNGLPSPLLSPVALKAKSPEYIGPPFLTATEQWKPRIEGNVLADLPDLMPDWQARLLIPLIFLNRPFENLAPQTRSQIGLLALLTLFHAIVIAVWALLFKH